jgi:hypothetical protein
VEKFVGLQDWLRKHEPELHAELYGGTIPVSLEEIEKAGEIHGVLELNQEIARIKRSIHDDPGLAVGSAKELLETVLRTILAAYGYDVTSQDMPALLKNAQRLLGLDPKAVDKSSRMGEVLHRILSNLGQVVIGVDEIRNLGGTGHGRSKGPRINSTQARLVINAAATIAAYFLEIWEAKEAKS